MKVLLTIGLVGVAIQATTVRGESFAERVDTAYRQKVNNVAMKQQMKPKSSNFEKRVKSSYTKKLDSLHKGAMSMGKNTTDSDGGMRTVGGNGKRMSTGGDSGMSSGSGKGMGMSNGGKGMMMNNVPSFSPSTFEPSV